MHDDYFKLNIDAIDKLGFFFPFRNALWLSGCLPIELLLILLVGTFA
jgi:hypothetical protein